MSDANDEAPSELTPGARGARAFAPSRVAWVGIGFAVWIVAIGLRLSQFMVFQRDHFRTQMETEAWVTADVPPLRGAILDHDGRRLAWSTRHFRVTYDTPADLTVAVRELEQLRSDVGEIEFEPSRLVPERTVVLAEDPAPETLAALTELAREMDDLNVSSATRRHYHQHTAIRRRLGTVKTVDGVTYGVSGDEKRYDHLLRGTAGKYRVMVGRDGEWMPGTWETLRELRPGYDVYLNVRLSAEGR